MTTIDDDRLHAMRDDTAADFVLAAGRSGDPAAGELGGLPGEPPPALIARRLSVVPEPVGLAELRRDPRRAISEDGIVCLVCGQTFRQLTNTHLGGHGLTSADYKQLFGYNARRALMIPTVRHRHSDNARRIGLAARIRRRRLVESPELRQQGGRHSHRLEELLTRRERPRPSVLPPPRDTRGRFTAARAS